MKAKFVVLIAVLAIAGAACSADKTPTTTPPASSPAGGSTTAATVEMNDNLAFTPNLTLVSVGATVTWKNIGTAPHTVDARNGSFSSGATPVAGGASFSHTFAAAGQFDYHCKLHPGMDGKITVTG